MSISILQKIHIKHIALLDSGGAYGEYLQKRQAQCMEPDTPYVLSEYMDFLVISYSKKCVQSKVTNKCFQKLYIKVLNKCNSLEKLIDEQEKQFIFLKNKVEEAEKEVQKLQVIWKELKEAWRYVDQTGKLPLGICISTVGELKEQMKKNEDDIKEAFNLKRQRQADLSAKDGKAQTEYKTAYVQLTKSVLSYRRKLDRLYSSIESFENKCDERLSFYWHSLSNYLEKKHGGFLIAERSKTFSEICQMRNVCFIKKEELLKKECDEINAQLAHIKGFEMRV